MPWPTGSTRGWLTGSTSRARHLPRQRGGEAQGDRGPHRTASSVTLPISIAVRDPYSVPLESHLFGSQSRG